MSFSLIARASRARSLRNSFSLRRAIHILPSPPRKHFLWYGFAFVISTGAFLKFAPVIHLDSVLSLSQLQENEETIIDPATSIAFPKTMSIPSKIKIPTMTLVGVGVRTVSFLGVKVYSVAFYADLDNPNLNIPNDMPVDEKIERIVRNSACVVRIVPVRNTSYTHLRDAFMRALQARMASAKQNGTLSEEEAQAVGSPMRKLKSLFPNSPLVQHTPLDIFLSAPAPGRSRTLIFRDLGAIESDWVATEFVLHYFEGAGPSPPLKKYVVDRLASFEK